MRSQRDRPTRARHVAILFAVGLVAAIAPAGVALILQWSNEKWALAFCVSAAIYLMGSFFWLALDPTEVIDPVSTT